MKNVIDMTPYLTPVYIRPARRKRFAPQDRQHQMLRTDLIVAKLPRRGIRLVQDLLRQHGKAPSAHDVSPHFS